jgi:hypothetical protein
LHGWSSLSGFIGREWTEEQGEDEADHFETAVMGAACPSAAGAIGLGHV